MDRSLPSANEQCDTAPCKHASWQTPQSWSAPLPKSDPVSLTHFLCRWCPKWEPVPAFSDAQRLPAAANANCIGSSTARKMTKSLRMSAIVPDPTLARPGAWRSRLNPIACPPFTGVRPPAESGTRMGAPFAIAVAPPNSSSVEPHGQLGLVFHRVRGGAFVTEIPVGKV